MNIPLKHQHSQFSIKWPIIGLCFFIHTGCLHFKQAMMDDDPTNRQVNNHSASRRGRGQNEQNQSGSIARRSSSIFAQKKSIVLKLMDEKSKLEYQRTSLQSSLCFFVVDHRHYDISNWNVHGVLNADAIHDYVMNKNPDRHGDPNFQWMLKDEIQRWQGSYREMEKLEQAIKETEQKILAVQKEMR